MRVAGQLKACLGDIALTVGVDERQHGAVDLEGAAHKLHNGGKPLVCRVVHSVQLAEGLSGGYTKQRGVSGVTKTASRWSSGLLQHLPCWMGPTCSLLHHTHLDAPSLALGRRPAGLAAHFCNGGVDWRAWDVRLARRRWRQPSSELLCLHPAGRRLARRRRAVGSWLCGRGNNPAALHWQPLATCSITSDTRREAMPQQAKVRIADSPGRTAKISAADLPVWFGQVFNGPIDAWHEKQDARGCLRGVTCTFPSFDANQAHFPKTRFFGLVGRLNPPPASARSALTSPRGLTACSRWPMPASDA